jgi:hypothetical protein
MAGTEPHVWGTGRMDDITYVGLDVHKATVCVAVAESGRGGEVRQVGVFENQQSLHATGVDNDRTQGFGFAGYPISG